MDFRITNYFAEFFMNILKLHPQKSGRYVVKAYLPQIKFTFSQQSVHFAFPDFTIWDKKSARLPIEPCCSNDRYKSHRHFLNKTILLISYFCFLNETSSCFTFFLFVIPLCTIRHTQKVAPVLKKLPHLFASRGVE